MDWNKLKKFTEARIGVRSSGIFPSTADSLQFTFAHACAQDAVHSPWKMTEQIKELEKLGFHTLELSTLAKTRQEYLINPELGRRLSFESENILKQKTLLHQTKVIYLISNGLSSQSLHDHLIGFLSELKNSFNFSENTLLLFVQNARVGLSNWIGELIRPDILVCIVGERPGLTSSNSLGVYLTFRPHSQSKDSDRNCISNIRPPHGQSYQEAAHRLKYLINEAIRIQSSGTLLKDESDTKLISK